MNAAPGTPPDKPALIDPAAAIRALAAAAFNPDLLPVSEEVPALVVELLVAEPLSPAAVDVAELLSPAAVVELLSPAAVVVELLLAELLSPVSVVVVDLLAGAVLLTTERITFSVEAGFVIIITGAVR